MGPNNHIVALGERLLSLLKKCLVQTEMLPESCLTGVQGCAKRVSREMMYPAQFFPQ